MKVLVGKEDITEEETREICKEGELTRIMEGGRIREVESIRKRIRAPSSKRNIDNRTIFTGME